MSWTREIELRPETIHGPVDLRGREPQELQAFAERARRFLIESVAETGGHIGANLGTVELSVALHAAFDSPREELVWDTGHQGYTHKVITGRAKLFPSLNTYGGMNRFLTRDESEHDPIEASHAGTSISVALGIALAKRLDRREDHTVCVIGDGALAEGMAFEGLNHAAVEETGLVIVLNDNGFAISPGFGGLHEALQGGEERSRAFFEALGFRYVGPVDGHDVGAMLNAFDEAKHAYRPALVHVKTEKGHGWAPADGHPFRQHFSFAFDPETGAPRDATPPPGYPDVAARVVQQRMETDPDLVCITPSTLYATGLAPVFEAWPERCFDPGMEEQHAMTLAVGLALGGKKPVLAYQTTFMQRAFDQLLHDVCFMRTNCLILGFRSGFAGYDNPTHHGIYDFAWLRGLPGLTVRYPKDRHEAERMVADGLDTMDGGNGPTLILMPYGPAESIDPGVLDESPMSFARAEVVQEGRDLLLLTVGNKFATARAVADALAPRGIQVELVNLRHLKPLPEEQLIGLMAGHTRVVTLEESVLDGGVGMAIAALAADHDVGCEFLRLGVPGSRFVEPGSAQELARAHRLDPESLIEDILVRWNELDRRAG